MTSFEFWRRWLVVCAAAAAILGLLFVVAPGSSLLTAYNREVLEAFHREQIPAGAVRQQAWSLAVLGSTILGWGILLAWVAAIPLRRRERWAWRAIAVSVLVWVVTDSIVSYRAGVYLEVLFNGVALALFALPLRMTYREVMRQPPAAATRRPSSTGGD